MTDIATTTTAARPPDRRFERPRMPHTAFLRELEMPDGRKAYIDKRSIAFLCEAKPGDFDGKKVCIVAFRASGAKLIPVVETNADLKSWWRGDGANAKAA
jgi:hypothetical protein